MYMAVMGLLSVILVLFCDLPNILSNAPRVNLPGQGDILGSWSETAWTHQKFQQFLGIPYAESPKGSLRFKVSCLFLLDFELERVYWILL